MRLFEGTEFDIPPRCDRCGELEEECKCAPEPEPLIPPDRQTARLRVEKRKKGKLVTVIRGLPSKGNDLPELLTRLKNLCGAGGTVREDEIEIQGDHLARIRQELSRQGFRTQG